MFRKCLYCISFFIVLSGPANAIHPLITDDTGTQNIGGIEIELAGEYGYENEDGTKEYAAEAGISLAAGVYETIDIVLGIPYQWIKTRETGNNSSEHGIGDLACEIKWRVFENGPLSLALKPGLIFPTGDDGKELGNGKSGYSGYLVGTYGEEDYAIHINGGYCRNRNVLGDRENLWHVSIAGEYGLTERFTLVFNCGCERNASTDDDTIPVFMIAGAAYAINDLLDIDCGIKWGCTDTETDISVLAGITIHFATIHKEGQEE